MHPSTLLSLVLPLLPLTQAQKTLIPNTVFNSQSTLNQYFSNAYPWGDTHNGAAKMLQSQVTINPAGTLVLTSTYTGPQSGASNLKYNSGTVYAKQQFPMVKGGGYDFTATFVAPVQKGTWPAFWLTATSGWPPEIDMAEWKGTGQISFNTFNTSSAVDSHNINYPNPTSTHTIQCQLRDHNGVDVGAKFFMDGTEVTTQYGKGYIGNSMWLIIDYQMEGSSGSPGPTSTTTYKISDLSVVSYNP